MENPHYPRPETAGANMHTSVRTAGRCAFNAAPVPKILMFVECIGADTAGTVCTLIAFSKSKTDR